jgi:hypothetical protein
MFAPGAAITPTKRGPRVTSVTSKEGRTIDSKLRPFARSLLSTEGDGDGAPAAHAA